MGYCMMANVCVYIYDSYSYVFYMGYIYLQDIVLYIHLNIPGLYVFQAPWRIFQQDNPVQRVSASIRCKSSAPGDRCNHANGFTDFSGSEKYGKIGWCLKITDISTVATALNGKKIGWVATSKWPMMVDLSLSGCVLR